MKVHKTFAIVVDVVMVVFSCKVPLGQTYRNTSAHHVHVQL